MITVPNGRSWTRTEPAEVVDLFDRHWLGRLRRKRRVAALALIAVLLGSVLPVVTSAWLAHWFAARQAHEDLDFYATVPLKRMEHALRDAAVALHALDGTTQCTAGHVASMRDAALASNYVQEVGYLQNGALACTSWGAAPPGIVLSPPDFTTGDGLGVRNFQRPGKTGVGPALAVGLGDHFVVISHARLNGVWALDNVSTALAYQPQGSDRLVMLAGLNSRIGDVLQNGLGDQHETTGFVHVGTIVRHGDFIAIAGMTDAAALHKLRQYYLLWLLPIGVALALLIVFNVIWLCSRQLNLKNETLAALRLGEFRLVYQPIIELETGACMGAEALIRWQQADGSYINPEIFIPVAEEEKIIDRVTRFAIRRMCSDLGPYMAQAPQLHVSLNLTAPDLVCPATMERLRADVIAAGIAPQSVWLEITERGLIEPSAGAGSLGGLRNMGFRIAIDDFGTGYSNLHYLQQLPLDALKIDKSFVDIIGKEGVNLAVIESIIDLGCALKLDIVAEGIETRAQLQYLRARSVKYGQGYYISRPLELDAFIRFYEACRDGGAMDGLLDQQDVPAEDDDDDNGAMGLNGTQG